MNTIKSIAQGLVNCSPRQGKNLGKAYSYIQHILHDSDIDFSLNTYETVVPVTVRATLSFDGKNIACKGSSFLSGKIQKEGLRFFTDLHSSAEKIRTPNINTNINSSSISRANFYFAPSISVSKKDFAKAKKANYIKGEVLVQKEHIQAHQFLIGNTINPKYIIFSHYDSIDHGAIDNASGVAVSLFLIRKYKDLILRHCLFVIDPNEELSYDYPVYWGHGYRIFEKKMSYLLKGSQKILVLDCVGNGKTHSTSNKNILKSAFPIRNIRSVVDKTIAIHGDIGGIFKVYHSDKDSISQLKETWLKDAAQKVLRILNT